MGNRIRIAIDGPSGAGKSTIARSVAANLNIDYIDTGAMYRAVALKLLREGVSPEEEGQLKKILSETAIDFHKGETLLDGEAVSGLIRTPQVSEMASRVSALPLVREKLVAAQREMGASKSVVMDGRDIGTNVFPQAEYKFFLTASVEERAKRRWLELKEKGEACSLDQVKQDIEARDKNDSTRALNPLKKAEDAVELDSTSMTVEQVVSDILERCRGGS